MEPSCLQAQRSPANQSVQSVLDRDLPASSQQLQLACARHRSKAGGEELSLRRLSTSAPERWKLPKLSIERDARRRP